MIMREKIATIILAFGVLFLAGCQKEELPTQELQPAVPQIGISFDSSSAVFGNDDSPITIRFTVSGGIGSSLKVNIKDYGVSGRASYVCDISPDKKSGTITFTPTCDVYFTGTLYLTFTVDGYVQDAIALSVGRTSFRWADGTIDRRSFSIRDDSEMELKLQSPLTDDAKILCDTPWIRYSMKDYRTILLEFELNDDRNGTPREGSLSIVNGKMNVSLDCDFTQRRSARSILTEFYETFGGPSWTRQENWLSDKPLHSWEGIEFRDPADKGDDNRLTMISLVGCHLTGDIAKIIDLLSDIEEIEYLRLADYTKNPYYALLYSASSDDWNHITGELPSSISRMQNLVNLDIEALDVSGPLPRELFDLPRIESFMYQDTKISGPIPDNWTTSHILTFGKSAYTEPAYFSTLGGVSWYDDEGWHKVATKEEYLDYMADRK